MLRFLLRDAAHEIVPLLLSRTRAGGPRAGVNLIHDNQLRALIDEHVPARVAFDVVDAQDLKREVLIDARVSLNLAVEPGLRIGANDDGLDADFCTDFLLPLVAEMRQAKHGEAANDSALQ